MGGCFTTPRRTDFVCLSIAYSVTVILEVSALFVFALLFLQQYCNTRECVALQWQNVETILFCCTCRGDIIK